MSDKSAEAAAELIASAESGRARFWTWAKSPAARHATSAVVTAVPIIAVNIVAFIGQFAYLRDHLPVPHWAVVLTALTLESIAVGLAYQAHAAQLSNDSTARLRASSYVLALIIGAMNYSHFADHWRPTVAALTFGLMSSISPWLWSVHSRRVSRDQLMAKGLIEAHAVRLGATRAAWHPLGWFRVMRRATWYGTVDPKLAIDDYMACGPAQIRTARQDTVPPAPHRAAPVPSLPAPAVPEVARQPVPAIESAPAPDPVPVAQETVPGPAAPAVPGRLSLVPAVHSAAAELTAEARVPAGVTDERKDEVATWLSLLTVPELAEVKYREVARRLASPEQSDQRRLGKRMLEAERATRAQSTRPAPQAPSNGQGDMIATPQAYVPGGVPRG